MENDLPLGKPRGSHALISVAGLIVAIILTLFLLYMLFRKNRYSDKAIEQRAVDAAAAGQ